MVISQIGSNMTQVSFDNGTVVLVSYSTPVAAVVDGKSYRSETNWSNTTSKHISKWGERDAPRKPQQFFYDLMANNGRVVEPEAEVITFPPVTKRPRVARV